MVDIPTIGQEVSAPLVFQCNQCKSIVGDTFAFCATDEPSRTITLSAASNISRTADLFTSRSGYDEGSTYFCYNCSICHNLLGKYYVTTSKDLDLLREKFTFNIDSIRSYQLGKHQHGQLPDPEIVDINPSDEVQSSTIPMINVANAETDILKIQQVVIDLAERLSAVEHQLAAIHANNNSNSIPTSNQIVTIVNSNSNIDDRTTNVMKLASIKSSSKAPFSVRNIDNRNLKRVKGNN
eukprot:gene10716-14389_t